MARRHDAHLSFTASITSAWFTTELSLRAGGLYIIISVIIIGPYLSLINYYLCFVMSKRGGRIGDDDLYKILETYIQHCYASGVAARGTR